MAKKNNLQLFSSLTRKDLKNLKVISLIIITSILSGNLFSQDVVDYSTKSHEIKIHQNIISFKDAKEYCRNLGDGWRILSGNKINLCIKSCNVKLVRNTFWTNKEVYMSSENVQRDNINGGYVVDYDAAEVYYLDKNILNPEKKASLHSVIFIKEKPTNLDVVKNSLSTAVQIGEMKVFPIPFSTNSFSMAQAMCKGLGDGWRLPSTEELQQIRTSGIYNEQSFESDVFWSGTRTCDGCFDSYYAVAFSNGNQAASATQSFYRYFAIYKSPAGGETKIWNFGTFEVNLKVFGPMTFDDANALCLKMSEDPNRKWRIPTESEMNAMRAYKKELPDMVGKTFWTYTKTLKDGYGYPTIDFGSMTLNSQGTSDEAFSYNEYTIKGLKYYFFMTRNGKK